MTVVSSKEFVSNEDKYFDMAVNEELCIKRGNNVFYLIYKSSDKSFDGIDFKSRQGWAKCAKDFVDSGNEEPRSSAFVMPTFNKVEF